MLCAIVLHIIGYNVNDITICSVFTYSRGIQMTKAMAAMLVSLTKEVNENFSLRGYQYGSCDAKCKHSIPILYNLCIIILLYFSYILTCTCVLDKSG